MTLTPATVPDTYSLCMLCPRGCAVDRRGDPAGFCGESSRIRAAAALLHFGEEPPITGEGGSGTVFFTGCTLHCAFCQNWQVSRAGEGTLLAPEELARVFLKLQEGGAENVNVVTGTHFAPGILEAYRTAKAAGLSIPLVWNSSGYETTETVRLLAKETAFFLPDLKTLDPGLSGRFFNAPDYPERAAETLLAMADAVPLAFEGDVPVRGLIVRHLVLPGNLEDTRAVLTWFKRNLEGRELISLMYQYTPIPGLELPPPFDRMISVEEYARSFAMLEELGIESGYFQEPETDGEWLPDFMRPRPFPSGKSIVVWHYAGLKD
jgi:putative pyruvate formate lyase activating enzyme